MVAGEVLFGFECGGKTQGGFWQCRGGWSLQGSLGSTWDGALVAGCEPKSKRNEITCVQPSAEAEGADLELEPL
jgi:hypothetical protein